jgi:hypothetical protein
MPRKSTVTAPAASDVTSATAAPGIDRRAGARATQRFVDPSTCERDYSAAEKGFMQAMHDYKKRSGRMFPTWSEVLEVLKALGYEKPGPPGP